jgi:hypothetical protein
MKHPTPGPCQTTIFGDVKVGQKVGKTRAKSEFAASRTREARGVSSISTDKGDG